MAYHRYHGLDAKIVRIFNTYGPRMRINDGRAVPNFIAQALRGEDVTIFGSGTQTRSFCYISDLVDGILALMASTVNEPVNIGNPHEMSIEEMARLIIKMTGSTSQSSSSRCRPTTRRCASPTSPARATLLGWEPKVPLEAGPDVDDRVLQERRWALVAGLERRACLTLASHVVLVSALHR